MPSQNQGTSRKKDEICQLDWGTEGPTDCFAFSKKSPPEGKILVIDIVSQNRLDNLWSKVGFGLESYWN